MMAKPLICLTFIPDGSLCTCHQDDGKTPYLFYPQALFLSQRRKGGQAAQRKNS
jgi:hypothetical protein